MVARVHREIASATMAQGGINMRYRTNILMLALMVAGLAAADHDVRGTPRPEIPLPRARPTITPPADNAAAKMLSPSKDTPEWKREQERERAGDQRVREMMQICKC